MCPPSDSGDQLGVAPANTARVQRLRQRPQPLGGELFVSEPEDVGHRLGRQLVALVDALQAGGEDDRERQVRVARRVGRRFVSQTPGSLNGTGQP